jgi:nucleoside-diphosphate-sugar epimerase
MAKTSILVTGGGGYIGSVLVGKLLERGHRVTVLDTFYFGEQVLDHHKGKGDLGLVKGDIRDAGAVKGAVAGKDMVIHLAAMSNDPSADLDPNETMSVNWEASRALVAAARNAGIRRFINASSASVYGVKETPNVTEDLSLEPITLYGKTKAMTEQMVREAHTRDFVTVSLRPATVCGYSTRQRLDLTVNMLTAQAVNRSLITVFGGTQYRPNLHIDDMTDLYCLMVEADEAKIGGEVFNAGYENRTVAQIATAVKDVVGPQVEIKTTDTNDPRSYRLSSEKILKVLGYRTKKTIHDAAAEVKTAFGRKWLGDMDAAQYHNVKLMKAKGLGR